MNAVVPIVVQRHRNIRNAVLHRRRRALTTGACWRTNPKNSNHDKWNPCGEHYPPFSTRGNKIRPVPKPNFNFSPSHYPFSVALHLALAYLLLSTSFSNDLNINIIYRCPRKPFDTDDHRMVVPTRSALTYAWYPSFEMDNHPRRSPAISIPRLNGIILY